ncbi:hypothetical protein BKK81_00640 [Cupriavidus sp. USMAHM13]|uniref:hypothetical protein n=1 Tax=Cupriavidus sp. USMAHM13 TaxID=1389192 RepID=UPI0008A6F5AB|nr:hypothetical protein [Cupriavidus sp. USMAHM13]AOY97965.1 hypothetical protein BKK81_00640 [Cupriavidus sp. USMAHM13]
MRRRWLPLLLVLFLLCGQVAASVHALAHLHAQRSNPCAAPADLEQCGPSHEVCPQCLVLAALAVALPAMALRLPASGRSWHFPYLAQRHAAPVWRPQPSSRGPPVRSGSFCLAS